MSLDGSKNSASSAPPYVDGGTPSVHEISAEEQPPSYEATTAAPNSLPPSYQSLYGEFQQVENPRHLAQFLGKAFLAIGNTMTAAITIAFLNTVPLFMIILGSVNLHHCPAQPLIPIWLVVSGVALLLKSAINFIRMKIYKKRTQPTNQNQVARKPCKNPFKLVLTLLGLFFIVWFMLGSVWVYEACSRIEFDGRSRGYRNPHYCDQFTYVFSFVYATFVYIATAIGILCCCCCCCCVCLRSKNRDYS